MNTPNATVTNAATVNGSVIINDVASTTWNENASGNTLFVYDSNATININNDVAEITVLAAGRINIAPTATVVEFSTLSSVVVTGAGNIVTARIMAPGVTLDAAPETIIATDEVVIGGDVITPKEISIAAAEAKIDSFTFTATEDIGSGVTEVVWGAFSYTKDGAFYMLQLEKDGVLIPFADVFEEFKLQTDATGSVNQENGNWHDYKVGLRNTADFTTDRSNHNGTSFLSTGSLGGTEFDGTLFYGIHSDILGVNFVSGDVRTVNFDVVIKSNVAAGDYKLTIAIYEPVRKDGLDSKYTATELLELILNNPVASKNWEFRISSN